MRVQFACFHGNRVKSRLASSYTATLSGKMNRFFGTGKPKEPPPNLSDAIANVDSRADSIDKKVRSMRLIFLRFSDMNVSICEEEF